MKVRLILASALAGGLAACATQPQPQVSGCPAVTYAVYFARDQVTLDPLANEILDTTTSALAGCAGGRLEIAGFADPAGDAEINQRISAARANAVLEGLMARGVTAEQVRILAFGENGARSDAGVTEPMRRRVEVYFIPAGM